MSTTVMSLKTDKAIKEKAQKIAKDMGFPLGTLINAFLRQFVKTKTVHFEADPISRIDQESEMQKIIEEAVADSSAIEGMSWERAKHNKEAIELLKQHGRTVTV